MESQEKEDQFHKLQGQGTLSLEMTKNEDVIPVSTFARKSSFASSLISRDIPWNSIIGQQRQQISEL